MANFSIYSLISIRTKASGESNNSLANTLANCVLPTPVCPKKINEPIGLLGSLSPTLFLCIAFTTLETASSCPMTLPLIKFGKSARRLLSASATLVTGISVIIETTSATFSSVTVSLFSFDCFSQICWAASNSFSIRFSSSRKRAASSYF